MIPPPTTPILAPDTQRALLHLARGTIAAHFAGNEYPTPTLDDPVLLEPRGAFVTLSIDGRLRGCIGHVIGVLPLWSTVRENAISAAFRDPRFPALTAAEFELVSIEISALTPPRISSAEAVNIGSDGLIVERGSARGLLLPQVAVEYGWDLETFLGHTCRKAGLDSGCWRHPDTKISTFTAEVFGEERVPLAQDETPKTSSS